MWLIQHMWLYIITLTIIIIVQVFLGGVMAMYYSGYLGYKNIDFT